MRNALVGLATVLVLAALLVVRQGGMTLGAAGEGSYTFVEHQPGQPTVPVTYSPCKPIRVEFNLDGVHRRKTTRVLLLEAMGEVSAASGLSLVYAGASERRPRWPDPSLTVEGGAWPVLIAFTDRDEVPQLEDNAGIGGSSSITRNDSTTYVSGQVALSRDYVNRLLARPRGDRQVKAIAMHELGHVVGLGHVQDPHELMSEHGIGQYTWGPGDRRGLALLGEGPCS